MAPKTRGASSSRGRQTSSRQNPRNPSHDSLQFKSRECRDLFHSVFVKKNIITGRCISELALYRKHGIIEAFDKQGWTSLLTMNLPIYPSLIQAFFANIELDEVHSTVITSLQGKKIILDPRTLARILNIPYGGSIATHGKQWITDPFSVSQQIKAVLDDPSATTTNKPSAHTIPVHHRIMHHIISYNFIPRDGHRDLVSFLDMFLLTHLISQTPFNLPHLMMWQIIEAYRKRISLPFGLVFTRIFHHFGIGVEGAEVRKLREPHDFYTEITFRRMRLKLHHGGYVRQEDVAEGDESDDDEEEDSEEMSWSSGDEEAQPPDAAGPSSVPSPAPAAAPASFSEGRPSSAAVDSDMRDEIRDLRQDLSELTLRTDSMHQDLSALSSRVDTMHQEIMDYLRSHLP